MVSLPRAIKDWLIAATLFALGYSVVYLLMAIPQ